jgi:hypothetical protein
LFARNINAANRRGRQNVFAFSPPSIAVCW